MTCSQSYAAQATASPNPVHSGETVKRDASGNQGTVLSYRWTQQSGPAVGLLPDSTAVRVHFVAPDVQSTTSVSFLALHHLASRPLRLWVLLHLGLGDDHPSRGGAAAALNHGA